MKRIALSFVAAATLALHAPAFAGCVGTFNYTGAETSCMVDVTGVYSITAYGAQGGAGIRGGGLGAEFGGSETLTAGTLLTLLVGGAGSGGEVSAGGGGGSFVVDGPSNAYNILVIAGGGGGGGGGGSSSVSSGRNGGQQASSGSPDGGVAGTNGGGGGSASGAGGGGYQTSGGDDGSAQGGAAFLNGGGGGYNGGGGGGIGDGGNVYGGGGGGGGSYLDPSASLLVSADGENAGDGEIVIALLSAAPTGSVPEPGTVSLLGAGLMLAALDAHRRRRIGRG